VLLLLADGRGAGDGVFGELLGELSYKSRGIKGSSVSVAAEPNEFSSSFRASYGFLTVNIFINKYMIYIISANKTNPINIKSIMIYYVFSY